MRRIASVLAAVLAGCALAAPAVASPEFAARANTYRGPVAKQANAGASVALFVLQRLGNLAANQNAGNGLGQFLMQLGFGDASASKLDDIRSTLNEIDGKLDNLEKSVAALGLRAAQNNCGRSQDRLADAQANAETAWNYIGDRVADAKKALANKAEQRSLSKKLVEQINDAFKSASLASTVTLIHNSLVGTRVLSSIINDCGIYYEEAGGDFISPRLRDEVASLVEYWQIVEAQVAVLNIGLLVDKGDQSDAKAQRERAENNLKAESARIKPIPTDPNKLVPDTRTHLIWWARILASRADRAAAMAAQIPPRGQWKLPSKSELGELAKKCCSGSTNAATWFRDKTPFSFDNFGLWTQLLSATKRPNGQFETLDLAAGKVSYGSVKSDANAYVLLVNGKSAELWKKYAYSP
ncbi:MAG TPA: hypothetical protein VMP89_17565 [Solirubrobacteraceae bacterium]|nr:hypothetical protein [Solirubrobacteraceae bacterium]